MSLGFKQKVYQESLRVLQEKVTGLHKVIKSIDESKNDESKSTAGDKHEVGRAMMQIELDKVSVQLQEANKQLALLQGIDCGSKRNIGEVGALIKTYNSIFFISVSIGRLSFNSEVVFVISAVSPIGQQLLGKREGDKLLFNGSNIDITSIC
jgi:uncharacterized protein Veg